MDILLTYLHSQNAIKLSDISIESPLNSSFIHDMWQWHVPPGLVLCSMSPGFIFIYDQLQRIKILSHCNMRRSTISNTYLHSAVLVVTVSVSGRYCDLTWAGHCYSRLWLSKPLYNTTILNPTISHRHHASLHSFHTSTHPLVRICLFFCSIILLWSGTHFLSFIH